MKIELVKETKINGKVVYSTEIDGVYKSESACSDYDMAKKIYQQIVETNGGNIIKEIIESTEL